MRGKVLFATLVMLECVVHAEPSALHLQGGRPIMVVLGNGRQPGIGVKPAGDHWKLKVSGLAKDCTAELVDVTPGRSGLRNLVQILDGNLVLDDQRFVGDHAYQLRLATSCPTSGNSLVYLYPRPVERVQQLRFEEAESSNDPSTIPIMDKGTL